MGDSGARKERAWTQSHSVPGSGFRLNVSMDSQQSDGRLSPRPNTHTSRPLSPRPHSSPHHPHEHTREHKDPRASLTQSELDGLLGDNDASSNSHASFVDGERNLAASNGLIERQLREERAAKEMALTYVKSLEAIIEAYRGGSDYMGGALSAVTAASVSAAAVAAVPGGRQSPASRRDELPCGHQRQCRLRTESLQKRLHESVLREKVLMEKVESLKSELSLADGPHAETEWVRILDVNRTLAVSVDSLKRKLKDEKDKTGKLEERLKKAELALDDGRRDWSVKENKYRRRYEGSPMHMRMLQDVAHLESENDSLSEMLGRAQDALKRSNEELAAAQAELEILRRDGAADALSNTIERAEKERLSLQAQLEDTTRQLCDMTREKKKSVDELVLRREQFRAEMDEIQRHHARELEKAHSEARGVRQQLEQEKYVSARLAAEVQSQDFELASTAESAAAERARGEAAHGTLSSEVQRVRTELQAARKELAAVREELGREAVARKVAEARCESLAVQLSRSQDKFKSLQDVTGLRASSPASVASPVASKDPVRDGVAPQSPVSSRLNGSPRIKPGESSANSSPKRSRLVPAASTSDASAHGDA